MCIMLEVMLGGTRHHGMKVKLNAGRKYDCVHIHTCMEYFSEKKKNDHFLINNLPLNGKLLHNTLVSIRNN